MHCQYCGTLIPEGSFACPQCNSPITAATGTRPVDIPQNFAFDAASGFYYYSEYSQDPQSGQLLQKVTWYDPSTGTYIPATYPVEAANNNAVQSAEVSQQSHIYIEGFALDTESGFYYRSYFGHDSATGADVTIVDWFNPLNGQYTTQYYPLQPAEPVIVESAATELINKSASNEFADELVIPEPTIAEQTNETVVSGQVDVPVTTNNVIAEQPATSTVADDTSTEAVIPDSIVIAQNCEAIATDFVDTAITVDPIIAEQILTEQNVVEPLTVEQNIHKSTDDDIQENSQMQSSDIPEGYECDPDSGWYYKIANTTAPQTGIHVQVVDWYNSATGNYTTRYYPILASGTIIPEGFEYNHESGFFCKIVSETDPQTKMPMQTITQYNPLTGQYSTPHNANEAQDAHAILSVEGDKPTVSGRNTKPKKSRAGIVAWLLIIVLVVFGIAAIYLTGFYEKIPFINSFLSGNSRSAVITSSSAESSVQEDLAVSAADTPDVIESSQNSSVSSSEAISSGPDPKTVLEAEPAPANLPNGSWSAFAHVSEFYSKAGADDEHLYILVPTRDPLEDFTRSGLIRVPHGSADVERVFAPGTLNAILSFALHDDYIYFCAYLNPDFCGYYRISKKGGIAEFLFLEEFSNIVSYEDNLYFMFAESGDIGIYNPARDEAPARFSICTQQQLANMPNFHQEFSVFEDELYFGYTNDNCSGFSKISLSSFDIFAILETTEPAKNLYLQGDSLFFSLYDEDEEIFSHHKMNIDSQLSASFADSVKFDSERTLFLARVGNSLVFQVNGDYYKCQVNSPLEQDLLESSSYDPVMSYEAYPFAIAENYLLFPNYAKSLVDDSTFDYEPASSLNINVGAAMERAKKAAEELEFGN